MTQAIFKSQYFFYRKYLALFAKISGACCLAMTIHNHPANAQNTVAIDSNTIAQPLIIRGTSNGSIKSAEIARTENTPTGFCDGYVDARPNHLLEIESFLESLRLEVKSSVDSTLMVEGSSGVWCNDDSSSANPMIEGPWQQGLYKVWVGSYQADKQNNYQIEITGK
ncbi:MAG: hypothetical protein AAFQ41_07285 [Cyanobacteria bacterium J06623_7]